MNFCYFGGIAKFGDIEIGENMGDLGGVGREWKGIQMTPSLSGNRL